MKLGASKCGFDAHFGVLPQVFRRAFWRSNTWVSMDFCQIGLQPTHVLMLVCLVWPPKLAFRCAFWSALTLINCMCLSSLFGSRYKTNTSEAQMHRSTQQGKTSQFRYHICGSKACTCRIGKDVEKKREREAKI